MNASKLFLYAALIASTGLATLATIFVAEPYYAFRASEKLGLNKNSFRTIAHAEAQKAINDLRAAQGEPVTIAFFGASTIEGLDVRRFGKGAANFAYGGWTMAQVKDEWMRAPHLHKGNTSIVLAGLNDLFRGRSISEVESDLAAMFSMRGANEKTILIGVLPVNPKGSLGGNADNETIAALNIALKTQCEKINGCTYIDPAAAFEAPLNPAYDRGDGVHLNADGYRALAALIEPALAD